MYSYEGQVASGLPIASQKYSGLKIKAQVRIQVKANSQAIVQVSHVSIMWSLYKCAALWSAAYGFFPNLNTPCNYS